MELATKKNRVNRVSQGMVIKELSMIILDSVREGSINEIKKMHPVGIWEVEDVANAIVFLISDKSKWITGVDLLVDGGYSAK